MTYIPRAIVWGDVVSPPNVFKDLADYGYAVDDLSGTLDGRDGEWPIEAAPGGLGSVWLADTPAVRSRNVTISGTLIQLASIQTMRLFVQDLTGFAARMRTLTTRHNSSAFLNCRLARATVGILEPQGLTPAARVTLEFTCADPRWFSTNATVVTLSATPAAITLLSAPVTGVTRIDGPAVNPTVTLYDGALFPLGVVSFTLTLSGGQWIEFDSTTGLVTTNKPGLTNPQATMDNGSLFPFVCDPQDTPSLAVSDDNATATGTFTFRAAAW